MIGYYVHHHGAGHAQRFLAARRQLDDTVVGLGSGPRPDGLPASAWVPLAYDATRQPPQDARAGGALHWAPLSEPGMRMRTAQLAAWVAEHDPRGIVVDVSTEVALTARLLSVPTVVIAQHGDREDLPHELAYRSARLVAALWNPGQHRDPATARQIRHVGPMSRFDEQIGHGASAPDVATGRRRVALLLGAGGHAVTNRDVEAAVQATKATWEWEVLAGPPVGRHASEEEVWQTLRHAHVVVASASNNCVGEVAAARRPLITLPQSRPYREQDRHAELLAREGLATSLASWPEPERWADLLDAAAARGGRHWEAHHDGLGATRLAHAIDEAFR